MYSHMNPMKTFKLFLRLQINTHILLKVLYDTLVNCSLTYRTYTFHALVGIKFVF